jgi:hypothetical protein
MSYNAPGSSVRAGRHPVQLAAAVVGAVFLLVGILGFIPGITTGQSELTFAGHESGALLLGLFAVSILHNLVHAAFGVAGLVLARTFAGARNYGLLVDHDSPANFVPVNTADNWLHLVLAVAMIAIGLLLGRPRHAHP